MPRLREQVAGRRAERPREDVGDPEREHGVQLEAVVRDRDDRDRGREEHERPRVADVQPLGGQVAGGGAEREGEEDGEPVEGLAARRVDRVDRQRPLARYQTAKTIASATEKTIVVVTSETPRLSVRLSVICVPTTLISTMPSQ